MVKPDGKVNAVKGYLVFKSAGGKPISRLNAEPFNRLIKSALASPALASPLDQLAAGRLQDFFASLIFARPGLAFPQKIPVSVEEKLVLEEFDYADPDGDGLYTAEIKTPAAPGEYEIITVLSYKDPEQGVKAIKLTTVIDPEGYIYEKIGDKELRVPGAIISLYWLNPETRLRLENAVRDLNNEQILAQWQKFTTSKTETEAQTQVKNLLELLVNKISL